MALAFADGANASAQFSKFVIQRGNLRTNFEN